MKHLVAINQPPAFIFLLSSWNALNKGFDGSQKHQEAKNNFKKKYSLKVKVHSINNVLQAGPICYEMWPNLICGPNHLEHQMTKMLLTPDLFKGGAMAEVFNAKISTQNPKPLNNGNLTIVTSITLIIGKLA